MNCGISSLVGNLSHHLTWGLGWLGKLAVGEDVLFIFEGDPLGVVLSCSVWIIGLVLDDVISEEGLASSWETGETLIGLNENCPADELSINNDSLEVLGLPLWYAGQL